VNRNDDNPSTEAGLRELMQADRQVLVARAAEAREDIVPPGPAERPGTPRELTYRSKTQRLTDSARELGLNPDTIRGRLCRGVAVAEALEMPVRQTKRGKPR
jgi:hypothetical protein